MLHLVCRRDLLTSKTILISCNRLHIITVTTKADGSDQVYTCLPDMPGVCCQCTRSLVDAEDVLQEGCIVIWVQGATPKSTIASTD